MIQDVTTGCIIAAWAGALLFVARYLRTRWFDSPVGRHAMAFMGVVLLVLSLAVIWELCGTGWVGRAAVRLVSYALIMVVIWWQVVILFTVQSRRRRRVRIDRDEADAMMAENETEETP